MVKILQAIQETQVRSLGQEDTLEKEMATHSSILAWRIPWTEEPGGLQSVVSIHHWCIEHFCVCVCGSVPRNFVEFVLLALVVFL